MTRLDEIEGIGAAYDAKLKAAGIQSVEALLKACTTKEGRAELAKKADIAEALILKWANHADLMRIKGIGGKYSELLEAAGVDTVPELARRKAENLVKKMQEVNEAKPIVRLLPVQKQVEKWILQAAELPRILQY